MMKSCKNKKEKQNEKNIKEKTYFVILELHSYTITNLKTNS